MVFLIPFVKSEFIISIHRSLLRQNSDATPYNAPSAKPAPVNIANPVRKPSGLPESGHGLAGASAAISPKGGNNASKPAQKRYATASVVAKESAGTFQELDIAITSCV